ncbi:myo-inositol dehydrogenase [Labrys miyagiensis]|uniref:Myo-inositol dehydrogenase n=1 Tax=Labrys miyagiensis TaxID=346912 RepID=A0ABQ6CMU1_9HYPH|nr:Gfo/Idh/MocA family oxidoreductase [Labrys miyagiensis]GLS21135.1 myo-inositol dehydrogenase [Labrys miyagiensis]
MTVRLGIIGVGVMGTDHARTIASQVAGASIRSIHDANGERARQIADEVGAADVAGDPKHLIDDPQVDAVLIASPDSTHKDLTLACVAARKPVLCEKPLAPTSRECLELIDAEVKAGRRFVQVGYMRRFDPSYVEMKSHLAAGQLGKPLLFHCIHRNVAAPPWFDGGMAIANSAVHEFDIARWLLSGDLTAISVFRPAGLSTQSPGAPVFLVLDGAGGTLVTIEVFNDAAYGYDVKGELVCEKGTVELQRPVHGVVNHALSQGTSYPVDWRPRFQDAYRLQAQGWIEGIRSGRPNGASAWDGYAATRVAEAGLQSLKSGRREEIPVAAMPKLYE